MVFHRASIETSESCGQSKRKEYHGRFQAQWSDDNFSNPPFYLASREWKKSKVRRRTRCLKYLHLGSNLRLDFLQPLFCLLYKKQEFDARTRSAEKYTNRVDFRSN